MSDILSVKIAMKQQRYVEAYDLLFIVDVKSLSVVLRDEFYELSLLILDQFDDVDKVWSYYRHFHENLTNKYRFKILKKIESENSYWSNSFFLYHWWSCLISLGNLSEAKKIGRLYIEHLLRRKNFHKGLRFLEEVSTYFQISVSMKLAEIRFLLQQENYSEIDKVLKSQSVPIGDELLNYFYYGQDDTWKKSQYLFEVILEKLYVYLEQKNFPQDELRGFVHLLYEYLVFFPNESIGVLYLLKYALISKKRSYVYKVKEVVLAQSERKTTHYDYEKDILAIIKALDSMQLIDSEDKTILANEFDFATDLIHGKRIRENMIKKLERDIQFLSDAGKHEHVEELKAKLKMIDKDNTLFFEEDDTTKEFETDQLKAIHKDANKDTAYEIYPPVDRVTLTSLQASLKSVHLSELERSFRDYMAMLFMLADNELIWFFITYLEDRFESNQYIQNEISYYKVLFYRSKNDFARMISCCDLILADPELDYDLGLECLYQKAEGFYHLGQWKEAKFCFNQVSQVDSNYRQVKHKLWVINEE